MVAALLVVAILAGAGAGYLVGVGVSGESTSTTSTGTSTTCIIEAEGEVLLQVLNDTSGKPIASIPVQAQFQAPPCPPNPHTTTTLNETFTNSTGFVTFGGEVGEYHLRINNYAYSVVVSTLPERTTCVTFSIPSGETIIKYSQTFQFSC